MNVTRGSVRMIDIMSKPEVTASENENIMQVAKKMNSKRVSSIVVVNQSNEPIGIVTEGDIIRRLLTKKKHLFFVKVRHVMSKPVVSVGINKTLEEAAGIMASRRIKRLCVVDDNNKLIGIVSEGDIVRNAGYVIDVLKEMINSGYTETGYVER
ncbi:MAG: cyclic nucleotide-binding/CBS domain-containing protein [Candidatus Micrarchaeia archaeon]